MLIETNRNTKENIQKITIDESFSNRVQFLGEKNILIKREKEKQRKKIKTKKLILILEKIIY